MRFHATNSDTSIKRGQRKIIRNFEISEMQESSILTTQKDISWVKVFSNWQQSEDSSLSL